MSFLGKGAQEEEEEKESFILCAKREKEFLCMMDQRIDQGINVLHAMFAEKINVKYITLKLCNAAKLVPPENLDYLIFSRTCLGTVQADLLTTAIVP